MTLYLIGLGLHDEKDITLRGLEILKKCDYIFLESYTSKLNCGIDKLETLIGKEITPAFREMIENKVEQLILSKAKDKDVAILVAGDPLAATTHIDMITRAKELKIDVKIIHNASIVNAIASTGLQLYKFGKTASIPYPMKNFEPETFYDILKENQSINAHTLMLLDIKAEEDKFMSVGEGIRCLLQVELRRNEKVFTEKTFVVGCARIGANDQKIIADLAGKVMKQDFGKPVHCFIIPAKMHFMEEEFLEQYKIK